MVSRLPFAVGIACALMFQSANAQPEAQIKQTSTPPVIDGNGNDAAWANANVYDTDENFFIVEGEGAPSPYVPSADFRMEWRALWDNTNLYVMAKVHDNVIVNGQPEFGGPDSNNGWEDDAVEFYIDAQNVDNADYRPENTGTPFQPTFQFTSVAGWTPAIANDPLNPGGRTLLGRDPAVVPNSSITWGTNSYGGNQDGVGYPQDMGSATSGPITGNTTDGWDYTFEASFPWTALQETPADILARDGIFGFGVAVNDDDFASGVAPSTRENQYMWASDLNNLWNTSASFPDVQLVEAAAGLQGDYNDNGTVDAADYTVWRNNLGQPEGNLLSGNGNGGTIDATDYALWKTNFGTGGGGSSASANSAVPEQATLGLLMIAIAIWSLRRGRAATPDLATLVP